MNRFADTKVATREGGIETLPEAPFLYVPLSAHRSHVARPVVQAGDRVLKHQVIARADDPCSAHVHAPVSGHVAGIREITEPDGTAIPVLMLRNDFEGACAASPDVLQGDPPPEAIADLLTEAGLVGEGGAQFPTALKYRSAGQHASAFIVNGAECEPYLTADYALMRERTDVLFEGIRLVNTLLRARDVVIVIEDHNRDLEAVFAPYLAQECYAGYRVQILTEGYPQGSARQVVLAVTGRELAPSLHPSAEGFVVSNVGTVVAACRALKERLPVVTRIVTVSGEGAGEGGNYDVPIGTPVGHLLGLHGVSPRRHTIVLGGPMMGRPVTDWTTPVAKGSGGILVLPRESVTQENCIGCARCVEACPMRLMPLKYDEGWRRSDPGMLKRYRLDACIECGACEYSCPANVPLMASIKAGKALIRGEKS